MSNKSALDEVLDEPEVAKRKKKDALVGEPTGVRLSNELRAQVNEICEKDGVPLATFIREAVEERALSKRPDLARRALLRSVAGTADQFERALEVGILKDTEAEEQAEDVRRFFGQLMELLTVEPEHEREEA